MIKNTEKCLHHNEAPVPKSGCLYVSSSAKTGLMEEQMVFSKISLFHIIMLIYCFLTVQKVIIVFIVYAYIRQNNQTLIRRRAKCTASD